MMNSGLIQCRLCCDKLLRKQTMPIRSHSACNLQVLHPKYGSAPRSRRLFSFGFALLHANALLYAADCTVAVALHVVRVSKEQRPSR
jgi:hypothetical protein